VNNLTQNEITFILARVKEISETHRNPDWKDNKQRIKDGKVCNRAAGPRDLGSTNRNQTMTRKMRAIASLGYLKELPNESFPFFILTAEGAKYLSSHKKPDKKK
jgi:hypothetical protein